MLFVVKIFRDEAAVVVLDGLQIQKMSPKTIMCDYSPMNNDNNEIVSVTRRSPVIGDI
jgi:hypothetical protein